MEKITEEDRLTIELAKSNKKIAEISAEKAQLQSDLAESYFRNLILEIYMKYKLTKDCSIDAEGNIIRKENDEQVKAE